MYPKLGAIPTPTGEEGEAGEPDKIPDEYANEGQQQHMSICKKWKHSCCERGIAVSIILTVAIIVVGGVLIQYPYLLNASSLSSVVPRPVEVMFDFSLK